MSNENSPPGSGSDPFPDAIQASLGEWTSVLGGSQVLTGSEIGQVYRSSTIGASRLISAALKPHDLEQAVAIVQIASKHCVPLYPISCGRNWGYGTALPVRDGCVIVDLSEMNRIELDEELGLARVQPGVTQQQLHEHLRGKNLQFLVPVTGGGPRCSLLGNALERGYGVTPYADHFGAVTSLEAVLPDGTVYRPALRSLGAGLADSCFKWGIGPYMDGLFTQFGLGIVTEMTIALAAVPERLEAFLVTVPTRDRLAEVVLAIRQALRTLGGVTGSINLMNDRRMLSMFAEYPHDQVGNGEILPPAMVEELLKKKKLGAWTVGGMLLGDKKVVAAARGKIKSIFGPIGNRCLFFPAGRSYAPGGC